MKSYKNNVTEYFTDMDLLNDQAEDRRKKLRKKLALIIASTALGVGNPNIFPNAKSIADILGFTNPD